MTTYQLNKTVGVVENIPFDATDITIDGNNSSTVRLCFYKGAWDWIKLPQGNWKFLSIASDMTEEMAQQLGFDTLESLRSWERANGYVTVNPYPKPTECDCNGHIESCNGCEFTDVKHSQAQQRTFDKYAILIKSK